MGLKQIKKDKKGIFFTGAALIILSFLFISYAIYNISKEDYDSTRKRVETMDNFVFFLEKDLDRKVYASGYRAIFILQKKIIETGEYIDDIDLRFQELFYNQTLYGENETLMIGVGFEDIIDSINQNSNKINVRVSFAEDSISITQDTPWEVRISLKGNLLVEDIGGLALWNRSEEIVAYIPIENFEDPLYLVNTGGLVTNRFNQTLYTSFVQGSDVSNLSSHLEKSYYLANENSPSFLNRFEGNLSSDENGIESFVYLPKLSNSGIPIKTKSVVDYIYFSEDSPEFSQIQGMPSWFKLDNENNRHDLYNVSDLLI